MDSLSVALIAFSFYLLFLAERSSSLELRIFFTLFSFGWWIVVFWYTAIVISAKLSALFVFVAGSIFILAITIYLLTKLKRLLVR